ncbi:hypothetical protein CBS101457_001229 [Exobasidium rhododendri]|nr:hypothetical protein CBS101457_001229 [Exobasidium rhododendri]
MEQPLPTKEPPFDLEQLNTLEETAYHAGLYDGERHGRLHGVFEGRELGTLKGFEIWEEIGQMIGVARFWLTVLSLSKGTDRKQVKQIQQLESLLDLIDTLPMENREEVNLFGMMERIRAKYKLVSFSLGLPAAVKMDVGGGQASSSGGKSNKVINSNDVSSQARVNRSTTQLNGRAVDTSKLEF